MENRIYTQRWRQVIIDFEIHCDYANPFLDVSIKGVFSGPSGEQIVREAYWDGGRCYRISFAPTAPGEWNWIIEAPKETGVNGKTGTVLCVPYEGEMDIYKHGFLKVHESGRYLTYNDGTPFFWMGDTHWEFAFGERFDESNHPKMSSMFKGMVNLRKVQGFTVYQTNLRSDPGRHGEPSRYWADGCEGTLPNVEFYQKELDRRMYYIADAGLVNALGFAWFMSIVDKIDLWKNMARYIMARYGALPVVWTLAGEVAGYAPEPFRTQFIDAWREVALYIEAHDSYQTLQTAHYDNHRPFSEYYYDEDWFDFTLNQAGHGDFPIQAKDFYTYRKEHSAKPYIEGESLYEYCSTLEENGTRLCTDDMVRRVAYTAMQCGACGYTYGAQGIWDNVWEKPDVIDGFMMGFNRFGIPWHVSVDGPGAVQMGYMRHFYTQNHFEEMEPVITYATSMFGVMGDASNYPTMFDPLGTANEEKTRFIVYYNEHTRGGCRICDAVPGIYAIMWYNPREDKYIQAENVTVSDQRVLDMPSRPDGKDWLLLAVMTE